MSDKGEEAKAGRRALVTGKIGPSFAAIYTTEYAGVGWARNEHNKGPRLAAAFQRVREQMSVAVGINTDLEDAA